MTPLQARQKELFYNKGKLTTACTVLRNMSECVHFSSTYKDDLYKAHTLCKNLLERFNEEVGWRG
jgi:pantothenate kinase-related protein Tda10